MLLDNMDGKQAVRTGSSSPVGELLDHGMLWTCLQLILILISGCDSVNVAVRFAEDVANYI
jgi:phosphatidylglycerophosphate synthase